MSLINKMLNELERNRKVDSGHSTALSSVIPAIRKQKGSAKGKMVFLVVILVLIVGSLWFYHKEVTTNVLKTVEVIKSRFLSKKLEISAPFVTSAPKVPEIKTPPKPKPVPQKPGVWLQSIMVEQEDNKSILDFVLSSPTTYYIEQSPDNQKLFVTLSNTALQSNLPVALENTFLMSLDTAQSGNNTKITVTLLPGTEVNETKFISTPRPRLHLLFSNPQLTKSVMSKKLSPLTPAQLEIEKLKEIQRLLAQDRTNEAIHNLHLFIGDFPNNLQARTMLVSLLIKFGRIKKADEILMVGLRKYRNYIPFIKLKARILINQHNLIAATNILEKYVSVNNDIELMALLAALYQQQGHFMLAAHIYNQLTKVEPHEAKWWIGLGISLESAQKLNAAREAYRKANERSNVPSELRGFLNEKIRK